MERHWRDTKLNVYTCLQKKYFDNIKGRESISKVESTRNLWVRKNCFDEKRNVSSPKASKPMLRFNKPTDPFRV